MSASISMNETLSKLFLICRLCGNASNSYIKVFGPEGVNYDVTNKIHSYLKVEVSNADLLPKVICHSCLQELNKFHNFFKHTHTVQNNLKTTVNKSLSKVKIKIELPENKTYNDKMILKQNNQIFIPQIETKDKECINAHQESVLCPDENEDVNIENKKFSSTINNLHDKLESHTFNHNNILKTNDNINNVNLPNQGPLKLFDLNENNLNRISVQQENNKSLKLKSSEEVELINKRSNVLQANSTKNKNNSSLHDKNIKSFEEINVSEFQNPLAVDDISIPENSYQNLTTELSNYIVEAPIYLPCIVCNEQLIGPQQINEHYYHQHPNVTPVFKCTVCQDVLENWKKFFTHYQKHKNISRYICIICRKSFSKIWDLKVHLSVHTDDKPFSCDKCTKSFKNLSSLKNHKLVHLPDECKLIYTCTQCNKSFRSKFILKTHQKIHTGQRDFICDICGESFINKRSLLSHITIHNQTQPFKCSLCNKLLKTEKLLNNHVKLHSIKKQFKCEYCGKEYRYDTQYNTHKRLHTGELPYKCDDCNKCFRLNSSLTVHKRQHTGIKPFRCNVCERSFTNWPNYNKHMKRRHYNTIISEKNNELILLKI